MSDIGDLRRAVDYALESVEQRVERVGRRLLRHWYAGCVLIGNEARGCSYTRTEEAGLCRIMADAMLAALDEADKEEKP